MPRHVVVLLLSLLAACARPADDRLARATRDTLAGGIVSVMSAGPTAWKDDTTGWRLVEASRITSGDSGAGELIDPREAVIDAAGRLYVADKKPAVIKVFDRAGRLIRTIGREGEGPGEYRTIRLGIHGSELIVHDPTLARASVFDTSGAFVRSWPSICCDFSRISVDRDGRIAILVHNGPPGFGDGFVRYSTSGAVIDTVWVPKDGEPTFIELSNKESTARFGLRNAPSQVSAALVDGSFVHGWSDRYRLAVTRTGRDTVQLFGREWTPTEIPASQRRKEYDEMAAGLKQQWGAATVDRVFSLADIPRFAAAVQWVDSDAGGNRWISGYSSDSLHYTYDIFDSTGAYLGPLRAPWGTGHAVSYIGADEVVVTGESPDGEPEIIRYRIERPSK